MYHIVTKAPEKDGICNVCNTELIIRVDDNTETIQNRLQTYYSLTQPLKEYYKAQGKLKTVDGSKELRESIEETFAALGI